MRSHECENKQTIIDLICYLNFPTTLISGQKNRLPDKKKMQNETKVQVMLAVLSLEKSMKIMLVMIAQSITGCRLCFSEPILKQLSW